MRGAAQPCEKAHPANSWNERVRNIGLFEGLLENNGGAWLTGRRLTYVDLSLFQIVECATHSPSA